MTDQTIVGDGKGLDILSASAVRAALEDCARSFHTSTGIGVTLRYDTSGGINKRAGQGEIADIYASSTDSVDDIAAKKLIAGEPLVVGASRIALGIRAGETAPDISTVEKFRAAMLAAKSLSRGDPAGGGTAGNILVAMFERLGILEPVAAKSILRVGGYKVMTEVAEGRADFGLTQSTEIVAVNGVKIGALLPEELQVVTRYSLAQGVTAPNAANVRDFMAHVAGAEGRAAFARAGFSPA
jgi:molybdate transport system substrate-binding protein